MKKYITLMVGVLIHMNIHAESYIFGGKAQFEGALVNQGCAIDLGNSQQFYGIKALTHSIFIHFSECSATTYEQITLSVSQRLSAAGNEFYIYPQYQHEMYVSDLISSNRINAMLINPNIQQYSTLYSYEKQQKILGIFIQQDQKKNATENTNLLISVFYP